MHVRSTRHLDAAWINDDQLGTVLTGLVDDGHEMQLRYGDVVTPDDDQTSMHHVLRPHGRHRAIGACKRFGFNATAQRSTGQEGGAKFVKKAQVHRAPGE